MDARHGEIEEPTLTHRNSLRGFRTAPLQGSVSFSSGITRISRPVCNGNDLLWGINPKNTMEVAVFVPFGGLQVVSWAIGYGRGHDKLMLRRSSRFEN
jgi:hypothetical protein